MDTVKYEYLGYRYKSDRYCLGPIHKEAARGIPKEQENDDQGAE